MAKKNSNEINGLRQKTHDGVDKIADKAEGIGESGKKAMHKLQEKAIKIKKNVDEYIENNPEKSLLIAAGTGVIVGAVTAVTLMRKKHKNKS